MAYNFRGYTPNQLLLLPPNRDDWLPQKPLARFISDVVDTLELKPFLRRFRDNGQGGAAFHPAMMLKVVLYAYCVGVPSSRKIAQAVIDDVAFRWLAANNRPDFRTIATFRRKHLENIKPLFLQVLLMCKQAGMATRALERAGREQEIVPLCEAETPAGYARLVNRLIDLERYGEAEHWIRKGILATSKKYPGIASDLRDALLTIKTRQQDWAAVAFLQVDEFVRRSSVRTFGDCKDAADRLDAWPTIRPILLEHLASGRIPWKEPEWPLPTPGKDAPKPERRDTFPRFSTLIEIAIHEKKPEEALRWYDRRPREHFFGYGPLDENVAAAVASHAPDRAIAIWKAMAEQEIARVKPGAYHEAAGYLRKVAKAMIREKKEVEWTQYLAGLRTEHFRKKRLLEVLDTLSAKPIVKKKR